MRIDHELMATKCQTQNELDRIPFTNDLELEVYALGLENLFNNNSVYSPCLHKGNPLLIKRLISFQENYKNNFDKAEITGIKEGVTNTIKILNQLKDNTSLKKQFFSINIGIVSLSTAIIPIFIDESHRLGTPSQNHSFPLLMHSSANHSQSINLPTSTPQRNPVLNWNSSVNEQATAPSVLWANSSGPHSAVANRTNGVSQPLIQGSHIPTFLTRHAFEEGIARIDSILIHPTLDDSNSTLPPLTDHDISFLSATLNSTASATTSQNASRIIPLEESLFRGSLSEFWESLRAVPNNTNIVEGHSALPPRSGAINSSEPQVVHDWGRPDLDYRISTDDSMDVEDLEFPRSL